MMAVPWETSIISELDLTSTELSTECLENILLRMPGFTYLALGYCEFFSDRVCPSPQSMEDKLSINYALQSFIRMFIPHDLFNITFDIDLLCDLEIKNC